MMNDELKEMGGGSQSKGWMRRALASPAPSATRQDVRTIILIYLVTTASLWVLAYGVTAVFPENQTPRWHSTKVKALDVWARWDSARYLDIARMGYQQSADGSNDNTRWFPLYPYLIASLMPAYRYQYPAAQLIALVAYLMLLFVLFDVVAQWHGKSVAHLAVLYLSIFPSALFFRAVYAESLFALLILLSYRAYSRGSYFRCGLYGALAAMTRPPGIMLLPAFAAALTWEIAQKKKTFRPAMLWIGTIAAGLAAVMLIQWRAVGDPLAFLHAAARSPAPRSLSFPGTSLVTDLKWMFTGWDLLTGKIVFHLLVDDIVAVLALVGAIYFFRRYGCLAGCLSLFLMLPPLMSGQTIGMIRYVLPIFFFPIFLAEIGDRRPWFHSFWLYASCLFLAFYTICFACWFWTA